MSIATSAIGDGEQAWKVYQDIQRVIDTRYQLNTSRIAQSAISMALQRLGETILAQHNLNPDVHQITKTWNLRLQHKQSFKLLTTKQMLDAHVVEWEVAIPSEQAGWDTWTHGREAGYRPQKSLQETLERDYSEIKFIVDITPNQTLKIYSQILAVVEIETNRLNSKYSSNEKIAEISTAVQLLEAAIAHKHNILTTVTPLSRREKTYVDNYDLYNINTMLDLKLRKWSLRQTLNLSSDSWLTKFFGLQEALWGKATSLQNVEKAL